MIYLTFFIYICGVLLPFDFYLVDLIISAIGVYKLKLIMFPGRKLFATQITFISVVAIILCSYLGLIYWNLLHLNSWAKSYTVDNIDSNKLLATALLTFIIFLTLSWFTRIAISGKLLLKTVFKFNRVLDWINANKKYKRMIFKIVRRLQIYHETEPSNIYSILADMNVKEGWIIAKSYYILFDDNTIKIKDEDGNLEGFNSYEHFIVKYNNTAK